MLKYSFQFFLVFCYSWLDYCSQKSYVNYIISAYAWSTTLQNWMSSSDTSEKEQTFGRPIKGKENLNTLISRTVTTQTMEIMSRQAEFTKTSRLSNYSLDNLKPHIGKHFQDRLSKSFADLEMKTLLRKMYAFHSKSHEQDVMNKTMQLLRQDSVTDFLESIGMELVKGVLADSKGHNFAVSVSANLHGIKEVALLSDRIVNGISNKLKRDLKMSLMLHRQLKIDMDTCQKTVLLWKDLNILDEFEILNDEQTWKKNSDREILHHMSSKLDANTAEKSIEFLRKINTSYKSCSSVAMDQICALISDQITEELLRIMNLQLLDPRAIPSDTCSSKRIQHHLLDELNSRKHLKNQQR